MQANQNGLTARSWAGLSAEELARSGALPRRRGRAPFNTVFSQDGWRGAATLATCSICRHWAVARARMAQASARRASMPDTSAGEWQRARTGALTHAATLDTRDWCSLVAVLHATADCGCSHRPERQDQFCRTILMELLLVHRWICGLISTSRRIPTSIEIRHA